jgi:hypothetical protein
MKLYLKNKLKQKGLEEWPQVIERLPSTFEGLSSNPSTTRKKKKAAKRKERQDRAM